MPYVAPYIDETGLHLPSYNEILAELVEGMKAIFGYDIYLDEDSQDYQQLSIFAKKIFDTNALALLSYDNRAVNTAIGTSLDNLCTLVGITRKAATYSKAQVKITGIPGTIIKSGIISDNLGTHEWVLPSNVTIQESGEVLVSVICKDSGKIAALPNTLTIINTPQYGWDSVNNEYAAQEGTNEETDAELRQRYSISKMLPSQSILESITSSLFELDGINRIKAYENDTGEAQEGTNIPGHSVCFVVQGGIDTDIAQTIFNKKAPGVGTYGTTAIPVDSYAGTTTNINFYRPTEKSIYLKITLVKLSTYTQSYEDKIKNALIEYFDKIGIAESVYKSIIWSVCTSQMDNIANPSYSITKVETSTDGETYSEADISIDFNELATLNLDNITVVAIDG